MKNQSDKKLFYFFLILFIGMCFFGILMWLYLRSHNNCPSYFGYPIMLLPAFACMLSKLIFERKNTPALKFYIFYFIVFFIITIMIILNVFFSINVEQSITMLVTGGSSIGILILWTLPQQELFKANLNIKTASIKKILFCFILSVFLLTLATRVKFLLNYLETGDTNSLLIPIAHWERFPLLFMNFFATYIIFFGEEYGWRYFLQPILLKKYGKRQGVLLVGIIWSLFHIPTDLLVNQLPFSSFLFRVVVCISLAFYLGWVYLYTQNIWLIACIHYLNNIIISLWNISNITFNSNYLHLFAYAIIFLPFAFSKSLNRPSTLK